MFIIEWRRKARKQLMQISNKHIREGIYDKVAELKQFPNCSNVKMLKNHRAEFRLRVGKYRILFTIASRMEAIYIEEVLKRDDQTY